ncbi:hypothetical protein [Cytobacillus firmus]|uniref:hypothetical protein n=1 Tax=Cytobacillus firmus TaxID=1399 RepID=UPI001C945666|nr:hypothetical protein [Cytobacillus firmus]MBY6052577.1 hypothetical protein [Cytobacillus firmus]
MGTGSWSVNITNRIGKPANRESYFAKRLLESANRGRNFANRAINTADAAGFNRKEDKLIPVTGFGRCDV